MARASASRNDALGSSNSSWAEFLLVWRITMGGAQLVIQTSTQAEVCDGRLHG